MEVAKFYERYDSDRWVVVWESDRDRLKYGITGGLEAMVAWVKMIGDMRDDERVTVLE